MSNPIRLGRYMYDYGKPQRMIFIEKRVPFWKTKRFVYPAIFFALLAFWAVKTHAECVEWGATRNGMAFVVDQCGPWPLLEWRVYFTSERA